MKGTVFDISRFRTDDGPGIRTAVFLKGCPLHCVWCHNPESFSRNTELFFYRDRCLSCGECASVCPNRCHALSPEGHLLDRTVCSCCGACAAACAMGALKVIGRQMTAEEILETVRRDRTYYEKSGGGLTITGGEPLLQPEFTAELAENAQREGFSVALETSGYGRAEDFRKICQYVDLLLFDYKLTDPALFSTYVGGDPAITTENLALADSMGKTIELRCPIIPDINYTPEHIAGIIRTAQRFPSIRQITLEPYHPLGISKRNALGKDVRYGNEAFLDRSALEPTRAQIAAETGRPTVIA